MPVIRKAHHAQFCATPPSRTNPVTRFGVSAEKVVATMEIPSNHQGIDRPARKNSVAFLPAFRYATHPIASTTTKKRAIMPQSKFDKIIYLELD
jgi:hypothetical protein